MVIATVVLDAKSRCPLLHVGGCGRMVLLCVKEVASAVGVVRFLVVLVAVLVCVHAQLCGRDILAILVPDGLGPWWACR